MKDIVITSACDMNYFNIYFKLWAKQFNKVYPDIEKIIYIYKPTKEALKLCKKMGIKAVSAELKNPDKPGAFYLLRWLNLPFEHNKNILSTQINCIPIKRLGDAALQTKADHLRLGYLKPWQPYAVISTSRGSGKVYEHITKDGKKKRIAGITASIFQPNIAEKIVQKAIELSGDPPNHDGIITTWKEETFPCEITLAIQKVNGPPNKNFTKKIEDYAFFIKAPHCAGEYTNEKKLIILRSFVNLFNREV